MMKLEFLVIVAVWGAGEAIVCLPGTCAAVSCLSALSCDGKVKNGGYCGCCPVCVKQLGEGELCMAAGIFLGVPTQTECEDGLHCDRNMRCVKTLPRRDAGTCATAHQAYLDKLSKNGGMLVGLEEPRCGFNGSYSPIQYSGSKGYCVSPEGKDLGYSVNRWETQGMNCRCALDQHMYGNTGLIGKLFYCGPNGNYLNYTCIGSVCWCKDVSGNKVGQSVNVGLLSTLKC